MADIEALIKQLGQLTVVEALELSKKLSKEWNIDLDNLQASANAPAVEAKPADAPEKQNSLWKVYQNRSKKT